LISTWTTYQPFEIIFEGRAGSEQVLAPPTATSALKKPSLKTRKSVQRRDVGQPQVSVKKRTSAQNVAELAEQQTQP